MKNAIMAIVILVGGIIIGYESHPIGYAVTAYDDANISNLTINAVKWPPFKKTAGLTIVGSNVSVSGISVYGGPIGISYDSHY